jgi:hypothetical protein
VAADAADSQGGKNKSVHVRSCPLPSVTVRFAAIYTTARVCGVRQKDSYSFSLLGFWLKIAGMRVIFLYCKEQICFLSSPNVCGTLVVLFKQYKENENEKKHVEDLRFFDRSACRRFTFCRLRNQ